MATKTKKQATPEVEKFPRKAVPCQKGGNDDEQGRHYSKLVTSPELAAYRAITAAEGAKSLGEFIDAPTMIETLREQATAVNRNDMAQAGAMLANQATALQSLFARLIEKSMTAEYVTQFEAFMRMALRAQSQCRATLETLAAIKNPPIVYARQANVTTGPQQINNGTVAPTRAQEIETEQTQLSGGTHELLPDARASGNASRVNPTLETLGEIDRAEVPRR